MNAKLGVMGIDQYGNHYDGLVHPRKDLLDRLGASHAEKLYRDRGGKPVHVGYVISGLWIELYEVHAWSKEVTK